MLASYIANELLQALTLDILQPGRRTQSENQTATSANLCRKRGDS